jgi:hypothetical protein
MTVTLSFNMDVGPEPERERLREMLGRGRDREGTKPIESSLRTKILSEGIGNPLLSVISAGAMLGLTRKQADSLVTLNRTFEIASDSHLDSGCEILRALPDRFDMDQTWARYKEARLEQLDVLIELAPLVATQLKPEQIRKLPRHVTAYLDMSELGRMRASGVLYGYGGLSVNY